MFVRVLFVEDVDTDAELASRRLSQDGVQCSYTRVETEAEFLAALRTQSHDIILSDFSLPQFDGMSALAIASLEKPEIPFIFVSGTIGEERAIEALRKGAKALKRRVAGGGTIALTVRPNGAGRAKLKRTGGLRLKPAVTYTPSGGEARTKKVAVTLRLAAPRRG